MQVLTSKATFKPITIVLENEDEVQKFYTIMNYPPLLNSMKMNKEARFFRDKVREDHPKIDTQTSDMFTKLSNDIKKYVRSLTSTVNTINYK
jgi:hypothetical protein